MTYYVGQSSDQVIESVSNRYFYGLRRTKNGELFVGKIDAVDKNANVQINTPGNPDENYLGFREGQNFFEGRTIYHNLLYKNLKYEQYRFDSANINYYINDEGELVAKINQTHKYDENSSSLG